MRPWCEVITIPLMKDPGGIFAHAHVHMCLHIYSNHTCDQMFAGMNVYVYIYIYVHMYKHVEDIGRVTT